MHYLNVIKKYMVSQKVITFGVFVFSASLGHVSSALAITDTAVVPVGVRALIFRSVKASVKGNYDVSGSRASFDVSEKLKAEKLVPMVPRLKELGNELKSEDAKLYQDLNFGEVDIQPKVEVQANAFGLAYGIADGFMLVGIVPILDAKVRLAGGYKSTDSVKKTIEALKAKNATGARSQKTGALIEILDQLPSPTGGNLQSAIVNDLGYKPVGDWSARGMGDIQLFGHYRFVNKDHYRQAVRLGTELATGRPDDPDNLVDVPFGKGNSSAFVQTIHDFPIWNEHITFHLHGKFDYQFKARRTYRLYTDPKTPLSSEKETLDFDRGHRWTLGGGTSVQFIRGLKLTGEYEYLNQMRNAVSGGSRFAYDYSLLTDKTDSQAHQVTVALSFSTVDLYMRKKFFLPFLVALNYAKVLSGKNTENVSMSYLHVEMYF